MEELKLLLDQILLAVASGELRRPDQELTAFFPVKGAVATGELMIIGRAVNGWSDGWQPHQALDSQKRQEIIERVWSPTWAKDRCPMSWIQRYWGATGFICTECESLYSAKASPCSACGKDAVQKAYNTAKSAFWRVMRSVTDALKAADSNKPDWPSHLIWSDLYKIAPANGGNPTSGQIRLQHDLCVQMLNEDFRLWTPRRVLFLTGLDWAEPFFSGIGVINGYRLNGLVSYAGRIATTRRTVAAVVAPHPQGKPEAQIVAEIANAFAGLEV